MAWEHQLRQGHPHWTRGVPCTGAQVTARQRTALCCKWAPTHNFYTRLSGSSQRLLSATEAEARLQHLGAATLSAVGHTPGLHGALGVQDAPLLSLPELPAHGEGPGPPCQCLRSDCLIITSPRTQERQRAAPAECPAATCDLGVI